MEPLERLSTVQNKGDIVLQHKLKFTTAPSLNLWVGGRHSLGVARSGLKLST